MSFKTLLWVPCILFSAFFTSSCTSTSIELDSAAHEETIRANHAALQDTKNAVQELKLSIDDALSMAVRENLDARVSALELIASQGNVTLERIKLLPSMEYSLSRSGRSNAPASSSLSATTGLQSLESSVSSERYRNTRDISLNWNIIDAASTLMQMKDASDRVSASKERHQKVIQNIHRDVYAAYWRAVIDDKGSKATNDLIASARKQIRNIDKAAREKLISKSDAGVKKAPYYEAISALEAFKNQSQLAKIELKSLLNLPQTSRLILTSDMKDSAVVQKDLLQTDTEVLELAALRHRPEMREAFLDQNISIRNTKEEIVRTLPGIEVFFAFNHDSNKFLASDSWRSYSTSLVQNIANIVSLPDRYSVARRNERFSEAKRITLSAAVIAQVNIARHGLIYADALHQLDLEEEKSFQQQSFAAQKKMHSGYASKSDTLLIKMRAQEKKLQSYQSFATVQESYATLINTLGFEVGEKISSASLKRSAS